MNTYLTQCLFQLTPEISPTKREITAMEIMAIIPESELCTTSVVTGVLFEGPEIITNILQWNSYAQI